MLKTRKPGVLGAADAIGVALSLAGADWLSAVRQQATFAPLTVEWLSRAALIVAAWLGALYVTGAYESRYLRMPGRSLYLTALATALGGAMCAGLFYLLPGWRMNRLAFAGFVLVAGLLLTGNRLVRLHWHRQDKTGATIAIGDHELLLMVWQQTTHESWFPRTLWLVPDDGDTTMELVRLTAHHPHEVRVCDVEHAKKMLAVDGEIHTVITDGVIRTQEASELLTQASLRGALVADAFSFYELSTGKCPIFQVDGRWLFNATTQTPPPAALLCKRLLDLSASVVAGVFALPVLVLGALAIAVESGFPVLYRQRRMGHRGKCFTLFKFRTMPKDAEAATGAIWSPPDDPRVTRLGALLRRTGIDELPQLWNVLLGQMSLVGPRPERPEIVAELRQQIPLYMQRHAVPPGITGWAQINQGGDTCLHDVLEKLRYDMYYAKNFSLKLDLGILLRTGQMALARAKPGTQRVPQAEHAADPRNTPGK